MAYIGDIESPGELVHITLAEAIGGLSEESHRSYAEAMAYLRESERHVDEQSKTIIIRSLGTLATA